MIFEIFLCHNLLKENPSSLFFFNSKVLKEENEDKRLQVIIRKPYDVVLLFDLLSRVSLPGWSYSDHLWYYRNHTIFSMILPWSIRNRIWFRVWSVWNHKSLWSRVWSTCFCVGEKPAGSQTKLEPKKQTDSIHNVNLNSERFSILILIRESAMQFSTIYHRKPTEITSFFEKNTRLEGNAACKKFQQSQLGTSLETLWSESKAFEFVKMLCDSYSL